jgi:hypothetical protein
MITFVTFVNIVRRHDRVLRMARTQPSAENGRLFFLLDEVELVVDAPRQLIDQPSLTYKEFFKKQNTKEK